MFRVLKGSPLSAGRRNEIPRSLSILDLGCRRRGMQSSFVLPTIVRLCALFRIQLRRDTGRATCLAAH